MTHAGAYTLYPYQAVLQGSVCGAEQHAASEAQVAVKPSVPQATAVWLDVQHDEAVLLALAHRFQLEAWAADYLIMCQGSRIHRVWATL